MKLLKILLSCLFIKRAWHLTYKNMEENKISVFEGKNVRRISHNKEWWFSIVDIIEILTESSIPRRYWADLKAKIEQEADETYEKIVQLKLLAEDGKMRETDCANTEGIFRIIQSIPSPKAEPFKRWLAKVGYERVQEIENPELAQQRMKELYEKRGYSKGWIDKRLRGIAVRQGLTDEWKERGISSNKDFAILSSEISKATFDLTPTEYKRLKEIKKENLRDHMTDLELIFSMLGESVTTEISATEKPKTFDKSKKVAKRGGGVAGNARKATEKELGRKVVSKENYLKNPENKKLLK